MTLDQLKEAKATYELYGTMVLHPELVNHLFSVAIEAAQPIATEAIVLEAPVKPARKARAKADD